MNKHIGGTKNIYPEELSVCLFTWKNNDPERPAHRDKNKWKVLA